MDSHWDGCWEAHHECAIVEIGRLKAELTEVNRAADMSAFEVGRLRAVLSRIDDSITDLLDEIKEDNEQTSELSELPPPVKMQIE